MTKEEVMKKLNVDAGSVEVDLEDRFTEFRRCVPTNSIPLRLGDLLFLLTERSRFVPDAMPLPWRATPLRFGRR